MKTLKRVLMKSEVNSVKSVTLLFVSLLSTLLLALTFSVFAQSNKLETEKGITEAVASYDADVRLAILQASEYPGILTQLKNSQTQTAESFQKMISRFRKQKQEWFYTITRYPDLVHQLANLPSKQTKEGINKLLPHQDPDLQEAAWRLYKSEKKNLAKLDNISMSANREFEKSIAHLNAPAREAFRKLQSKPDVLALLTDNIDLTIKLGEHYQRNPSEVTNQLAMVHDKLENQNQRDAAAFKKQMDSDPKAMKEFILVSSTAVEFIAMVAKGTSHSKQILARQLTQETPRNNTNQANLYSMCLRPRINRYTRTKDMPIWIGHYRNIHIKALLNQKTI